MWLIDWKLWLASEFPPIKSCLPSEMSQLLDFPADVLLHIVQFLEVEDAVSFSLVS